MAVAVGGQRGGNGGGGMEGRGVGGGGEEGREEGGRGEKKM